MAAPDDKNAKSVIDETTHRSFASGGAGFVYLVSDTGLVPRRAHEPEFVGRISHDRIDRRIGQRRQHGAAVAAEQPNVLPNHVRRPAHVAPPCPFALSRHT